MSLGPLGLSSHKMIPCIHSNGPKKYIEVRNSAMLEVNDARILGYPRNATAKICAKFGRNPLPNQPRFSVFGPGAHQNLVSTS